MPSKSFKACDYKAEDGHNNRLARLARDSFWRDLKQAGYKPRRETSEGVAYYETERETLTTYYIVSW